MKAGVRHGLVLVRDARRAARAEGQGRQTRIEQDPTWRPRGRTRRSRRSALGERLEDRSLMTAIPGYDYVLTGYSWPNPSHITYSIAPDGVLWDHGTNDLNAVFNAKFGTSGVWQAQIARAAGHLGVRGQHQHRSRGRRPLPAQRPGHCPVATRVSATSGSGDTPSPITPRRSPRRTSPLPTVPRPRETSRSTPR